MVAAGAQPEGNPRRPAPQPRVDRSWPGRHEPRCHSEPSNVSRGLRLTGPAPGGPASGGSPATARRPRFVPSQTPRTPPMLHPSAWAGLLLTGRWLWGPAIHQRTGRDETRKGQESLRLFFLLPHFYTMYSTQFLSQGNDSKSVGMQGPENGVRLCLALKSALLATPLNIPVDIKMES